MGKRRSERRQKPRVAKFRLAQANSFVIGQTTNLSSAGARIELHEPPAPHTRVSLDLALDDRILEVTAQVVYVEKLENDRFGIGLEFVRLGLAERKILEQFLSAPV